MTKHFTNALKLKYGKDLSVYSALFLKKTIIQRIKETDASCLEEYMEFIVAHTGEWLKLTDSLHITYSRFFRNSLDSSLLEGLVVPQLVQSRGKNRTRSLRFWSAGCADGSEAFSLAMIANEIISVSNHRIPIMVFGTDILPASIEKAIIGTYDRISLHNTKLSYIDRYFCQEKIFFSVTEDIKRRVDFSLGDLTDHAFSSPPAAIFADFDVVSCCNLMIYYNHEMQQVIMKKLYNALAPTGFLVVGESEHLIVEKFGKFRLLNNVGNVFIKN